VVDIRWKAGGGRFGGPRHRPAYLVCGDATPALAISVAFLSKHPIHQERMGPVDVLVLTDASGANRVYEAGSTRIVKYDQSELAEDQSGGQWSVTEDRLLALLGNP
jgi:hypothetical protein